MVVMVATVVMRGTGVMGVIGVMAVMAVMAVMMVMATSATIAGLHVLNMGAAALPHTRVTAAPLSCCPAPP